VKKRLAAFAPVILVLTACATTETATTTAATTQQVGMAAC